MFRTSIAILMEAGDENKDKALLLRNAHVPGGKGAAIAHPLDVQSSRLARIPRPHEVAVQRMGQLALDCALRGVECLCHGLTAKGALNAGRHNRAAESILTYLLNIDRLCHRCHAVILLNCCLWRAPH